ncbi:hypothetical protein LCGC14_1563160 [marine sediment metagenome]|uniref:Uncharacterized protein n=1 Tax=marine sediment metagenome TaxID=412755 RepID=A0A0F9ILW6_9ZZZZ
MRVTVETSKGRGQVVGFAVAVATDNYESHIVLIAIEQQSLQVFKPKDCKVLSVESECAE